MKSDDCYTRWKSIYKCVTVMNCADLIYEKKNIIMKKYAFSVINVDISGGEGEFCWIHIRS